MCREVQTEEACRALADQADTTDCRWDYASVGAAPLDLD